MDIFHVQNVKRSRKWRWCDWCGERIDIGQPYHSYRWADAMEAGTVYMHPECCEASAERLRAEAERKPYRRGFYFDYGEFARGSTKSKGSWHREADE